MSLTATANPRSTNECIYFVPLTSLIPFVSFCRPRKVNPAGPWTDSSRTHWVVGTCNFNVKRVMVVVICVWYIHPARLYYNDITARACAEKNHILSKFTQRTLPRRPPSCGYNNNGHWSRLKARSRNSTRTTD